MKREWTDHGWRRRFAWFPIFLSDGPKRTMIWGEWYWRRFAGLTYDVSLTDPRPTTTTEGD